MKVSQRRAASPNVALFNRKNYKHVSLDFHFQRLNNKYEGRDLEAMSFAENYHRWILRIFAPYLGSRLVEVGAGTGSFSELLLERAIESLTLVEPSGEMFKRLQERIEKRGASAQIETLNAAFADVAAQIESLQQPDSIIYVNVLEHIADDERELKLAYRTLSSGGRIFVFVPALRWLYGSFDKQIGHRRRYTLDELSEKCRRAGFEIVRAHYFDVLGIVPWWIKYCLLKSERMEPAAVKFYDEIVVPFAQKMESALKPGIGKNIVLIGEKLG